MTIPDRNAGKYGTAPAIALDDLGGFVVVYGINNVLDWSTGHAATSSTPWTVTIVTSHRHVCARASYPRLTCHTGMLTLAYLDGSTRAAYPGSIVRCRRCRLGQLDDELGHGCARRNLRRDPPRSTWSPSTS